MGARVTIVRLLAAALLLGAAALRADARLDVLGPAPYPIARVNQEWRYRIAVRTRDLTLLREAIRQRVIPLAAEELGIRLAIILDA